VLAQRRRGPARLLACETGAARDAARRRLRERGEAMDAEKLSRRWLLAAAAYFLLSVGLGTYMGASGRHELFSVHSHAALLGWVSMGLTALLYRSFPQAAQSRLARWHFYLYQLAVPAMLIAVAALVTGRGEAEPVAGMASVAVLASVLLFCWIVLTAGKGR
jgi:L-asparagine transporter-like permease